jgi:hypothetical protein
MLAMLLLSLDMLCTTCAAVVSGWARDKCPAHPYSPREQLDVAVLQQGDNAAEEAYVAHIAATQA